MLSGKLSRTKWQSRPWAFLTRAHICQSGISFQISSHGYPNTCHAPRVWYLLSITACHWSRPVPINDSGSGAMPSKLQNLLRAPWVSLGTMPQDFRIFSQPFWAGMAAASSWLAQFFPLYPYEAAEERKSAFTLCMWKPSPAQDPSSSLSLGILIYYGLPCLHYFVIF